RHCRRKLGAADLGAVIGADELRDDVARKRLASLGVAETGFHDVPDQRADLDDVAALCFGWKVDDRARHYEISSAHAATVTTTSCVAFQNEPSLSCAIAVMVCESARRMRDVSAARPERGPR